MKFGRTWGRLDMKCKLSEICEYAKGKVELSELTEKNYISTENMLPNKAGITIASSLPSTAQTQRYQKNDVLVSNIRPYFKKVWLATHDGGCSNDILVFKANGEISSEYLYYVLSTDEFFEYSMSTSKGTKMPRGDKKAIMEYEIFNHDIDTQKKIASLLKSLDDKIEVNNTINDNLAA